MEAGNPRVGDGEMQASLALYGSRVNSAQYVAPLVFSNFIFCCKYCEQGDEELFQIQ